MCGIVVYKDLNNQLVNLEAFKLMCSSIEHRGPDSAGYALLNNKSLALGSLRLSIKDLENGDQPLHSLDQNISLVCNGEIYDYAYWRDHLEKKGHRFKTTSDSELIIYMYKEYNTESFVLLNGEFAFALWDNVNHKLIIARDRAGVKPLFYYKDDALFLVGSEIKALFANKNVPKAFSQSYFTSAALGVTKSNACAFKNIHNLKPGHYLVIDTNRVVEEKPYFTFNFTQTETISFEASVVKVKNAVETAVNRRLVADVPVNCYLSGGLDSNIICGLMAQKHNKFTAYHASFPNSKYDEYVQAKKIASYYGQKLEVVTCDAETLLEHLAKTIYHVEMPLSNCNSIGKLLLSRLVNSNGDKVCLTGEGSDEIFGGYAYFKLEKLWTQTKNGTINYSEYKELWRKFQNIEQRSLGLNWHPSKRWKHANKHYKYPSYLYINAIETGKIIPYIFKDSYTRKHLENTFLSTYPYNKTDVISPFNTTRSMALQRLSGAIIPFLGDRIEMANSIECRTPFLDNDVINIARKLPSDYFIDIKTLREKNVLYRAFKDLIPNQIANNHKHPFISPNWKSILNAPQGKSLLRYHFSKEEVKKQGVFNYKAVQAIFKFWDYGSKNWNTVRRLDPLIGIFLTTSLLHEKFIEGSINTKKDFKMIDKSYS